MEHFIEIKEEKPEELEDFASKLTEGIQTQGQIEFNNSEFDFNRNDLDQIVGNFLDQIDFREGGAKSDQKFPRPNNYEFLLREAVLNNNTKAKEAVELTLEKMAYGGIYDHLGGGFSRYTVDEIWKVPHFEKMLYDNGQLVTLYSHAYQQNKNPLYKKVIEETLDFIKRELTSSEGGFYSSLDADSEGEEGKFYVWTKEEIEHILGDEDTDLFMDYYNIKSGGNWEHDKNILFRKKDNAHFVKKYKVDEAGLLSKLASAKAKLKAARDERVRPGLDDKILSSWNALMLNGYIDAYRALGNEEYLAAAKKNGAFLINNMLQSDNRLNRNYKDGKSVINAFLDDYAFVADAFISLYQVTFDEKWLNKADDLIKYSTKHFSNEETKMFNFTSDLDPPLAAKKMDLNDDVIPSSNSAMARTLFKMGKFLYNADYVTRSKQMMNNMNQQIIDAKSPAWYSNWCQLYAEILNPPYEVAIVGDAYQGKLKELSANYLPNALLLGGKTEGNLELLKNKLQEGETMIYVCQNRVCKFPVTEVPKALGLMD